MQKEFSHILNVVDLPVQEQRYKIVASGEDLSFVTEVLKVPEVKLLDAELFLKREKNIISLWGNIAAELVLESVVSLKMFSKKYQFDFVTAYDTSAEELDADEEDWDEDMPEKIVGGKLDLVTAVIEQLALQMEDHPRQEGEEFLFKPDFDVSEKVVNNPFDVLAKLKK